MAGGKVVCGDALSLTFRDAGVCVSAGDFTGVRAEGVAFVVDFAAADTGVRQEVGVERGTCEDGLGWEGVIFRIFSDEFGVALIGVVVEVSLFKLLLHSGVVNATVGFFSFEGVQATVEAEEFGDCAAEGLMLEEGEAVGFASSSEELLGDDFISTLLGPLANMGEIFAMLL